MGKDECALAQRDHPGVPLTRRLDPRSTPHDPSSAGYSTTSAGLLNQTGRRVIVVGRLLIEIWEVPIERGLLAPAERPYRARDSAVRVRAMSKPKLTYFDAAMSRGEECRLALHLAGIDFEDERLKREQWPALKPTTPFGSLPTLALPGKPVLAQSTAILVWVGRGYGLHPKDDFEAARHEAMMQHAEDLRAQISPTMRMTNEEEKKAARKTLAEGYLPTWGANTEKQIGDGPFFGGASLNVVDLKLHLVVRWVKSGVLDHLPPTVFDAFPKLNRLNDAVANHEGVKAWYARK